MVKVRARAVPSDHRSNVATPSVATDGAISETVAPAVIGTLARATPFTVIALGVLASTVRVRSRGSATNVRWTRTPEESRALATTSSWVWSPWSSNGRENEAPVKDSPGWSWQYPPLQCTSCTLQVTGRAPSSRSVAVALAATVSPTAKRRSAGGLVSVRTGEPLNGTTCSVVVPVAPRTSVTVSRAV